MKILGDKVLNTGERKTAADSIILSKKDLSEFIRNIKEPEVKAFVSLMYLTAGRVSEVLLIRRRDMKTRIIDGKEFVVIRMRVLKKWKVLKVHTHEDGTKHQDTVPLKRFREAPIRIDKGMIERELFSHVHRYIKSSSLYPDDFVINKSRSWAWLKMSELDTFNHYFRHLRITHLVQQGFTDQELVQFVGWQDSKPAAVYTHLRWQDVAKKL